MNYPCPDFNGKILIKTHDSELQGHEEASLSELFARNTAKKFANTLVKVP